MLNRICPLVLASVLMMSACTRDRVDVRVLGKEDLSEGPTRTCMVNVEITNRGSAMLRSFNYWLSFNDNRRSVPYVGPVSNVPAGGSKTNLDVFVGVPCAQVPSRLDLHVEECVMGERDCRNAVSLRP